VGSYVAEFYWRKGSKVTVLDNLSRASSLRPSGFRVESNWSYIHDSLEGVRLIEGDILDSKLLIDVMKDIDFVVHTAGQTAVTKSLSDPLLDFRVNVLGTFNVLEALRKEGQQASLLFCSTNKVYGNNVDKVEILETAERYRFRDPSCKGFDESFPVDHTNHTPYGTSKLAADLYVQEYAHTYGIKTGVFRMSCIYGDRQFGVEDQGWVSWFCSAALNDSPITIYGNGKQVRDVLYVSDLVECIEAFRSSDRHHGVFNVGGGLENTLSLRELITLLDGEFGLNPRISYAGWRPADQRIYVSDITKAREELGWEPRTSPVKGIHRLVKWARSALASHGRKS